jgi:hypothetical protein
MKPDVHARRRALDPAVADILGQFDQRDRLAAQSPAQRRRARKDKARNRIVVDMPAQLEADLGRAARREGLSVSALVTFLARHSLEQYQRGDIDLGPYKRPSRSMRFEFVLKGEGDE